MVQLQKHGSANYVPAGGGEAPAVHTIKNLVVPALARAVTEGTPESAEWRLRTQARGM
jgi:hypothetical protein